MCRRKQPRKLENDHQDGASLQEGKKGKGRKAFFHPILSGHIIYFQVNTGKELSPPSPKSRLIINGLDPQGFPTPNYVHPEHLDVASWSIIDKWRYSNASQHESQNRKVGGSKHSIL